MNLKSRLARLEDRHGNDACPGCGFRPDDIRTVVIGSSRPRQDGSVPPLCEVTAEVHEQPRRPVCDLCGGWMPPIAFVGVGPDEPPDNAGEGSGDG
jgi:hypothetical protein